ncbi:MAG: DUF5305 family protein [Thermincola sp.]|nr:DUF5305 family protein [Thermincola sp.]MDT3701581.1 DUF5305 family protein [Thermincola sp.]
MKRLIITFCIIVSLITSSYALFLLKVDKYEEKKQVHYSYQSKSNVDYKVFLRPNVMYNQEYLEKGRYYVFKYIDRIDIKLKYEFTGSAPAHLKTDYLVKAYLQGLHGKENEILWSKEFVLVPQKAEEYDNSSKAVIELTVPVSMDSYRAIKETIFNDSEINSPTVLNVVFDVRTLASTKNGTLEDKLSPTITIPIGENVFKIAGELEKTGENAIAETIKAKKPVDMRIVTVCFALSSVFLLITVLLAVFIKVKVVDDAFDKATARIFKEYGERLAGMEQAISYQFADIISVTSFEDMVKIADEVGQPVFYYKVNTRMERKIEFYVFDGSRIYYMVIFGEIRLEADSSVPARGDQSNQLSI